MRKNILKIAFTFCLLAFVASARAVSLTVENAPEYITITTGEAEIEKYTSEQIAKGAATATEQAAIDLMNAQIMSWQNKHNLYLKSAKFGEAIANACTLFSDGVCTLRSLYDVYVATHINPQGTLCAGVMSNLYLETACDFISVYSILKKVIKGGGENNMIDGSKKMMLLWQATDVLERLNSKLNQLAFTITVTSFEDVWNAAIAGMIDKTHGQLAREAQRRCERAINNVNQFVMYKNKHKFPI